MCRMSVMITGETITQAHWLTDSTIFWLPQQSSHRWRDNQMYSLLPQWKHPRNSENNQKSKLKNKYLNFIKVCMNWKYFHRPLFVYCFFSLFSSKNCSSFLWYHNYIKYMKKWLYLEDCILGSCYSFHCVG